jgi:5-methyltetrahydrofolate--homocysteine methyltransferase
VVFGINILISHIEAKMQIHDLTNSLVGLQEDNVLMLVDECVMTDIPANTILKAMWEGMSIIGDRYNEGTLFISEMMFAGEILRKVMIKLNPILDREGGVKEIIGKVILGTIKGDIHDLGKDIVKMVLNGNGFHVVDLGVDVAAEKFIKAIKAHPDAKVIGMSVLLTSVFPALENIVAAIKAEGLRDKIKIMVGGGAVTARVAEETGCDHYGEDAVAGVKYSKGIYNVG